MSHRPTSRRLRGFTLVELIILLPVFSLVMFMALCAAGAQMSTHRRLVQQANRHAVMRSVLNHLRHDFAEASGFEFESPACMPAQMSPDLKEIAHQEAKNPSQSLRLEVTVATVRLTTPTGTVTYHLQENAPLYDKPDNTTQRICVSFQTLERVDPDSTSKKWPLRGQTLVLEPGDDLPARTLHISFETRLQSKGAIESLRQYQTTLLTGGRQ